MLHKDPNWKRTKKGQTWQGYIRLNAIYDCPYSDKKGRVFEHKYIWWKNKLDDPILKGQCLHHINGIKDDNRIENLQKISIKEHNVIHGLKRRKYGPKIVSEYQKEYKAKWAKEHRHELNKRRRDAWKFNTNNRRQKDKEYRSNHLETIRKSKIKYALVHRDRLLASKKRYYERNKFKILLEQKLKREEKLNK